MLQKELISESDSATRVFRNFFDEHLIDNVVFQTNLYAVQNEKRFEPLQSSELYAFLGLTVLFGYHKLPALRDYWSTDPDLAVPIVPETMTRDRYFGILSNLHLADNKTMPTDNKDKLYKVRPLINMLNAKYLSLRSPSRWQSIDESMVLFKGRSSIKQYNPMKSIKRGYKLWCRSDMDGYIYEFDVYQGKSADFGQKELGLGGNVIWNLTQKLNGQNYIVAFDNFFTSPDLLDDMKSRSILACKTVRPNRKGLPTLAPNKSLTRGQFDFRTTAQGLLYVKWKDSKAVHFLSNFHGTEQTVLSRTQKDGSKLEVTAPMVVADYNKEMGGMNKADMLRSIYDLDRKSRKWWHRLFFAMFEITLVNAYVTFCDLNGKIPYKELKRKVAIGLLTLGKDPHLSRRKRGRPRSTGLELRESIPKRRKSAFSVPNDIRLQNVGAHWPEFVERRARCELCSSRQIESRPHSRCTICKVFMCCNEKRIASLITT